MIKKFTYIAIAVTIVTLLQGCNTHSTENTNIKEKTNTETETQEIKYTNEEIWNKYCTSDKIIENCSELVGKEITIESIYFLSGETIELKDREKYIIEVMATDCYHCNKSMDYVLEYKNKEQDISLYTCCFADDPIVINEWMKEKGYSFDMGMLEYDTVKYGIGIKYTPCFLFVENKIIKLAYIGEIKDVGFIKTLIRTAYKEQL